MLTRIIFVFAVFCPHALASVTVTVNGASHTIPQTNEKGWGANVTAWIQAISQYTLQNSGGTFTLTAEANTGATYGFKVPYIKTATATPSTVGVLRMAVSDSIGWRNNANGANLLLAVDGSNNLTFNGGSISTPTTGVFQDSTFYVYDDGDATKKIALQASGITTATTRTITMPDANVNLGALTNSNIDPAAAIAYSKLNLATSILNADVNASAGIALTKLAATTVSRALVSDGSGFITPATTTATEIGYVNGVTSAIQTQMNLKAPLASPTFSGTITTPLTLSRALTTGASSELAVSATTATELGYVNGVTQAIQTQFTNLLDAQEYRNCSITASIAASALTVALKDAGGSDASATSPCKIAFRNATVTTGTVIERSVTAALSIVISNGSAVGCTASSACVIYVYAVDSGSGVVLGLMNGYPLDEGSLTTGLVLAGSGNDDAANTLYTTATQTTKPIRLIGRVTITPAASFAWTNAASEISNIPLKRASNFVIRAAALNCDSSSAITRQTPFTWIASIGNVSSSCCTITLNAQVFNDVSNMYCTATTLAGAVDSRFPSIQTGSVTSLTLCGYDAQGAGAGASIGIDAWVMCIGTGAP